MIYVDVYPLSSYLLCMYNGEKIFAFTDFSNKTLLFLCIFQVNKYNRMSD